MDNIESQIEWLHRQGHSIVSTDRAYWYNIAPRIYQMLPYYKIVALSEEEISAVFDRSRALGLRYSTPLDAPMGKVSYHVIYRGVDYGLAQLPKKARYDVRRGLKHVTVEPIPLSRLATEGWKLRFDTLQRQNRQGAESPDWWSRLCLSAEGLPGFEAWAALHEGEMVASLLAFTTDDCTSILYQQSLSDHLSAGVNNALTFVFTEQALKQPGVSQIFYGLHSLDAPASVDRFKFRMNFHPEPVRQRVAFHPWLTPFVNSASHSIVEKLHHFRPRNRFFAKAEGMFRFYLEGQRPLAEQHWPECLEDRKDELLAEGQDVKCV